MAMIPKYLTEEVSDEALLDYRWAAGDYFQNCKACGDTHLADKRALNCKPCATRMYLNHQQALEREHEGVGIAGAMDYTVTTEVTGMICNHCGKEHETPYGARASPMTFWCSKECYATRKEPHE